MATETKEEGNEIDDDILIVEYAENCVLLKSVFNIDEQTELYKQMMTHPWVDLNDCSLVLAEKKRKNGQISSAAKHGEFHQNELKKYEDASSIYAKLLKKILQIIKVKKLKIALPANYKLSNGFVAEYCCHDQINGSIAKHYDDEPGFVILYSLGCIANFFIQSPKIKETIFGFESGDVLIFDCSKKSKLLHSVESIQKDTCPEILKKMYKKLGCHRYSLQTRMQQR